jgi:peptidoglycan/LPS O-acetylase OafA/YrhL
MLGSFIYRKDWRVLTPVSVVLFGILAIGHRFLIHPGMLIGIAFGIPAVILLKDRKGRPLGTELGNAAYGCFLCQGMVLDALIHFGLVKATPPYIALATVLSCLAGYASYRLIEHPTLKLRRSFRSAARSKPDADFGVPVVAD